MLLKVTQITIRRRLLLLIFSVSMPVLDDSPPSVLAVCTIFKLKCQPHIHNIHIHIHNIQQSAFTKTSSIFPAFMVVGRSCVLDLALPLCLGKLSHHCTVGCITLLNMSKFPVSSDDLREEGWKEKYSVTVE